MNLSLKKLGKRNALFLIAHPPYLDIVKFTDQKEDLSNVYDLNLFLDKIVCAFRNALPFLEKGKVFFYRYRGCL